MERDRSHRQRQRSRDLSHRRRGISPGRRRACAVAADLAPRPGTKCDRLCPGPIGNLWRLPLLRATLIEPPGGTAVRTGWLEGDEVCPYFPPALSQAAISARSSPVISVTLPGGIAFDQAALRPIRRALRRI